MNKHQKALAEELKDKYYFDRKGSTVLRVGKVLDMEPGPSAVVFKLAGPGHGSRVDEIRVASVEKTFFDTPREVLVQEYNSRMQDLLEATEDLQRAETRVRACQEKERRAWAHLQQALPKQEEA